ncbi:Glutathione S-transferase theta-1 [Araneus ventricosus]|uniref:Glutathione S-transferase theta-1 n=1 Tax=Araneus ventricosus TaxID=182803 RepID=A0A4Y2HIL9_ARAVE|nr:Glutathione S-transferase theta-1 [Araneus ventricosus]
MSLRVYYDLMSQPCRALLIFLKRNNIPFESKVIALRKGEHMTPEFAKLNPFRKVPVLEHNGFVLTESVAMIRYLAKEFPIQDNWYPKDSKAQARVDEYLEWQHLNTRLFGSMVFREREHQATKFGGSFTGPTVSTDNPILGDWVDHRSAVEVLQRIPADNLTDLTAVEEALESIFGDSHLTQFYRTKLKTRRQKPGESLQVLAADVEQLMSLAYSECPLDIREHLEVQYLVDAIRDKDILYSTRLMDAKDLKSALAYIIKYEAVRTVSKMSVQIHKIRRQWRISAQALEAAASCLEILGGPQNLCEKHHSAKPKANLRHCSLVYSIILSSLKSFSLFALEKLVSE